jgi:hypothetical protein
VPGSEMRWRRRRATFVAVIPVAPGPTFERCGSRPNSGQSSSGAEETPAALGIEAGVVAGVETDAGALLPQAPISEQAASAIARRDTLEPRCADA